METCRGDLGLDFQKEERLDGMFLEIGLVYPGLLFVDVARNF